MAYENASLEDISALVNLNNLENVFLGDNKINNISSLASLPNIKIITIDGNPTLTTLGAQFTAPKLTELNVSNCALTSLNELSGLPELASIDAQDNYLTDVSVFKNLPKLKGVAVNGNCLTEEAIQEYVDWFNANDPVIPLTYDDVYSKQDYAKCQ